MTLLRTLGLYSAGILALLVVVVACALAAMTEDPRGQR
jgi:hypothetical protein